MVTKEEGENKPRRNSNFLILIVSTLLFASIALSVVGLLNGNKDNAGVEEKELSETQTEVQNESQESLTDMFQKEFSEESDSKGGYSNDPFREICKSIKGDYPAMSSFTVCQP